MAGKDNDLESSNSRLGSAGDLEGQEKGNIEELAGAQDTSVTSATLRDSWSRRSGDVGVSPNVEPSSSPHLTPSNALRPHRRHRPAPLQPTDDISNMPDELDDGSIGSPDSQSSNIATPYSALPSVTLNEASTVGEHHTSPTLSDLGLRRRLSGTTDVDSLLSGPSLGGEFDRSFGAFSSPRPANPSASPGSPSDDRENDHSTTSPSDDSHPFSNDSIWNEGPDPHEEELQSLRLANLNLQLQLTQSEQKRKRLQSSHNDFRKTLQAFRIIPMDNAQPTWKTDSDGERTGPLYNDIPNIYRESTVELLIHRAALRLTLGDIDTMFNVSTEALSLVQKLNYPPLTARCCFINAVSLYHKRRFAEALEGFNHAYGADQYGIDADFVRQWATASTNALDTSFNDTSDLATQPPPPRPTGTTKYDNARKLWGFPGTPVRRSRARTTPCESPSATTGAEDYSESGTLPDFLARTGAACDHNHPDSNPLVRRSMAQRAAQGEAGNWRAPNRTRATTTEGFTAGEYNAVRRRHWENKARGLGRGG